MEPTEEYARALVCGAQGADDGRKALIQALGERASDRDPPEQYKALLLQDALTWTRRMSREQAELVPDLVKMAFDPKVNFRDFQERLVDAMFWLVPPGPQTQCKGCM